MAKGERRIKLYVAAALLVGFFIEFLAFISINYIVMPSEPSLFFRRPELDEGTFQRYVQSRDPLLGWPARKNKDGAAPIVSRNIPSFPMSSTECVSLYGDSFTYGDEVSDAEAWSNVLSKKLGCRVANYGVGGYGTDQAFLRYRKNTSDEARLVILGIFPDNVMRNVNQYRYFLDGRTALSLKPRFVLDGDKLTLIVIPDWNFKEFSSAMVAPAAAFPHESFLPDSTNGPITPSFPYTWRALKLVLSERVRSGLLGHTSWEVFYDQNHPTKALTITVGIAEQFRNGCQSRNQLCRVLVYPTGRSFKQFKETGRIATKPLTDELERRGIEYIDLHEPFGERVTSDEFCELLTQLNGCAGHFNATGNRLVAEIIFDKIKAQLGDGIQNGS